ncbi:MULTISPECIES: cyclopropane-fatty-acyl-phospholipid synthase [Sinorhizobium]|jgi:cyclopropane-fatty-acyl-phospholipid synthase|uniref:cyclopropane-fatty-acyl-phospholipid synthase n=1 Tax=Sinorhizobium TaxID=28105 RepID=UPI0023D871B9|nr:MULTISPECIES: cyclopropane-fatty-acyl-phospholipid synthase [Sinorhizobium]WEJ11014.1 cyclopropane-fatty-acyl-phospholipid synthase [Sinorhizobium sp. M103]WEJ14397.1 cyclopropane-fatty-acyl-phospholipid synthase [Sinorhizobium sp. K101]WEJ37997.1 cyclopropane-fatty-acyl-phospholipid synthase [Sinorhizobium sp. C101]WRQ68617.1 cyclopropane-fatty-acyl-phospholipid synthase [Sinorhizobium meliloti]
MNAGLLNLLRRLVEKGKLTVVFSSGEKVVLGDGTGKPAAIRFADAGAEKAVLHDPGLKFGEMYMDGRVLVEEGDIFDVLAIVKSNDLDKAATFTNSIVALGHIFRQQMKSRLPVNRNRYNVAHHYDLDGKLFNLFLDEDWQYSCAYFHPPGISLDEAQRAKKRHIAAKLLLEPGQKVLEVGSGWGGMAMYLAESSGVEVTGITLSEEQLKVSRERAARRGLSDRVRFELQDYRTMQGRQFDRIVSVGMFEHVGIGNYGNFFRKMKELLKPDGVMLLHSIGQIYKPWATNPWIEKYIFPGGYIPALSEVLPRVESNRLLVKDIEILPLHYAWTLRAWRERFLAQRDEAVRLYDERFFRMWEFYLAASETAFLYDKHFVFQLQLSPSLATVPVSRDYIAIKERELLEFEKTRERLELVAV